MSQKWEMLIQDGERLVENQEFCAAAKVFEKALKEAEKKGDGEMRVDSLKLLALALFEGGNSADAEKYAKRALELAKAFDGETSRHYGQSMLFLADIVTGMGELNRANELASVSVGIIEGSVSSHDCDSCRAALMNAYWVQIEIMLREGEFEQAAASLRKMWQLSGSLTEFEAPTQETWQKFLQEFEEKRQPGKMSLRFRRI